jgi:translocation and assembly module TamA
VSDRSRVTPARRLVAILLIGLSFASGAMAQALSYRVSGVTGELRDNLRAHIGDAPESREETERFLVTAPARAARALESLGYYEHRIEVKLDREREPSRVEFVVASGDPVTYTSIDLQLRGEGADTKPFQQLLRSAPGLGDPLHHGRYEDFKAELQQLARQLGYFDSRLERQRIDLDVGAREARLTLHFETGSRYAFGELRADEALLAPEFLDRLRPFADGTPYSQARLLELRQRLLRLGYFGNVIVLPEVAERQGGTVPVRIEVVRAPAHSYEVGLGYSTDTRQRVSLLWRSPHLNRYGHSQQTSLRWSPVNPELRSTYSIPLNDPASDVLQGILRLESNEFGDLESDQRELALRRERTRSARVGAIQLRALSEAWSAAGEDFDAAFLLAGASYSRRNRYGDAVDPDAGLSQFYEVEVASSDLGSDEDLLRFRAEFLGVRRLGRHWRVVGRGEAGMLFSSSEGPDEIPPSLAFFAGGDRSIRGYAYQSVGRELSTVALGAVDTEPRSLVVGGTRLATASLELQRYLATNWRVAAFVDGGDAFTGDDFDLNLGVGIGIHYLSPVGALRFEIADPVTSDDRDWRVHINIGAEF